MGERKGVNKYYPPDFDPAKHKSLNGYHGTHALRERAKKIDKGIVIIRFEMPYNIWCEGCGIHIAMGVRYNAEKTKSGMYYTTPIYKFRMKCHLCDTYFEIQTDPQNRDYVILEGARRKEQRWDPAENEQIVTDDKSKIKKLATDAMYKLEHGTDDKNKTKKAMPALAEIADIKSSYKDDYLLNKLARQKFRDEKKGIKMLKSVDEDLLNKSSLDIKLVKEHEDDKKLAHLLTFKTTESYDEKQKKKRTQIETGSIFGNKKTKIGIDAWKKFPNKRKSDTTADVSNKSPKLDLGIRRTSQICGVTKKTVSDSGDFNSSPKLEPERTSVNDIVTKEPVSESEGFYKPHRINLSENDGESRKFVCDQKECDKSVNMDERISSETHSSILPNNKPFIYPISKNQECLDNNQIMTEKESDSCEKTDYSCSLKRTRESTDNGPVDSESCSSESIKPITNNSLVQYDSSDSETQ